MQAPVDKDNKDDLFLSSSSVCVRVRSCLLYQDGCNGRRLGLIKGVEMEVRLFIRLRSRDN